MYRRELLRLLSVAGVLVSVPAAASGEESPPGRARTLADLGPHARLNEHLWQVFALATSKRQVYPLFDANEYGNAVHCYSLAASAGQEARSYDRWACAGTRRPGDLNGCQRNLDTAGQVLDLSGPASPGGWLRFDSTRLGEERGTCYQTLDRADLAEHELDSVLAGTASPRRRGSILADLAMIGVQHKDTSQILRYASDAIDIAEQTHSVGYLGRKLTGLQERIQPLLADARMAELNDRISRHHRETHPRAEGPLRRHLLDSPHITGWLGTRPVPAAWPW
jgi:hypothetical protein